MILTIRKFIAVLYLVTGVACGVFCQDCSKNGDLQVEYYKTNTEGDQVKLSGYYLQLCDASFLVKQDTSGLIYQDPDLSTPSGIRFFLLKKLPENDILSVPVTSRYFKSVTDFNLRFYWDKDSLQFDRVSNMHPRLYRIVQTGLFEEQQGYQELRINPKRDWQDTISIPDGEVLFEMCFTPLVEGPGEIPIHVRKHPYSTGDSLSFEIIGVPVDARANTGIINMLDEKDFYYEIVPLCTSSDAELYDFKLTITGNNGPYTYSFNDPEVRDSTFTDSIIKVRDGR